MTLVTQDSSKEVKLAYIEERCLETWRHCREYDTSEYEELKEFAQSILTSLFDWTKEQLENYWVWE
jgi:AAA+ ATPase superfamily predicted ATPase